MEGGRRRREAGVSSEREGGRKKGGGREEGGRDGEPTPIRLEARELFFNFTPGRPKLIFRRILESIRKWVGDTILNVALVPEFNEKVDQLNMWIMSKEPESMLLGVVSFFFSAVFCLHGFVFFRSV
jgi:hypothetical protein